MRPRALLPNSRWVLAVSVVLVQLGIWGLLRLPQDHGALAAFPPQAPEVQAFRTFDAQFGAQRTLQAVVEAEDVFAPAFLRHLADASEALGKLRGMGHVLSMATVMDIAADPAGGMITGKLMDAAPSTPQAAQALRAKVLSRAAVMGNLVANDGRAVQLVCSLDGKVDAATLVPQVQAILTEHFGAAYGLNGVPAIAATVAAAGAPLQHWGSLAAILWLGLMGLAVAHGTPLLQSVRPYVALLLNTSAAPLLALAAFGLLGGTLTPTLALVPLVGAILTSALSLQALGTLRQLAEPTHWGRVQRSLAPTWAAGLSSAAVLAIPAVWAPRSASLLAAGTMLLGTLGACWVLPAFGPLSPAARTRGLHAPRWLALACLLLAVALGTQLRHVAFTSDLPTLMGRESAPARAESLLARHFGTGAMLQVEVAGDLREPAGLRRLQALVDSLALTPGVAGVSYVGDAFRQANAAMDGAPRLPDSRAKAELLFSFLSSDPSSKRLMSGDAQRAVLYVSLHHPEDAPAVQAAVADATGAYRKVAAPLASRERQRSLVLRLQAAARAQGILLSTAQAGRIQANARRAEPLRVDETPVVRGLQHFLASEESMWFLPQTDPRSLAVAQAIAAQGPHAAPASLQATVSVALRGQAVEADLVQDWLASAEGPLQSLWTNARYEQLATFALRESELPTVPAAWREAVADALSDYAEPEALVPGSSSDADAWQLEAWVHGQPILDGVLGLSTARQWWRTLLSGSAVALAVAVLLARALGRGLLVASPIFTTALLLFGGLAALNMPLDPATAGGLSGLLALGIMQAVHTCTDPQRDTRTMHLHAAAWGAMFILVAGVTEPPLQRLAVGMALALVLNAVVTWLLLTTSTVRDLTRTPLPQAVGGSS